MRGSIRAVFWNGTDRRLRLPWRLLLAVIVLGILSFGAIRAFESVIQSAFAGSGLASFGREGRLLIRIAVELVVVGSATYLAGRFLDRRRFADFGFHFSRTWWVDFGFGLALGGVLMTGIFAVELAVGWVRVTGYVRSVSGAPFVGAFLGSLVLFVLVGVSEELLVRGYLLTNLAEGFRWFRWLSANTAVAAATLCSSVVFGVSHVFNPNATLTSTLVIVLAGVMLATGYVLTGELGVPIGLHVAWNFFQTSVYGFSVSGLRLPVTLIATRQVGPPTVTGGPFGPEAGLVGVAAILLGMVAIAWWVRVRGTESSRSSVSTPELR